MPNILVIPPLKVPEWTERIRMIAAQRSHPKPEPPTSKDTNIAETFDNPASSEGLSVSGDRENSDKLKAANDETLNVDQAENPQNLRDSIEQQALRELMKGPEAIDDTESVMIIQQPENSNIEKEKTRDNELESFRRLVASHPDEGEIDYQRVPIQEFGIALLRGMGWKPGMSIGKNQTNKPVKLYEPRQRPTHLGLGASVLPSKHLRERSSKYQNGHSSSKNHSSRDTSPSEASEKKRSDRSRSRPRRSEYSGKSSDDRSDKQRERLSDRHDKRSRRNDNEDTQRRPIYRSREDDDSRRARRSERDRL